MIIYFTGTGNSKYIADILAKQLDDTVLDATAFIRSGEHPSFESEKPYVFVSPVYAWRLPRVLVEWIGKCTFGGNKKVYFVIDCGDSIGAAGNYAEKLAARCGFEYMGTAEIVMPENYLVMFTPTAKEDDGAIISAAAEHTVALCEKISAEAVLDKIRITFVGRLCSDIVNPMFYTFYIGAKKFYATDECIGCGKCVSTCMLNNIMLKNGKPVWGKDCTHCMACICKCPTEAIEYGKSTKGRRRYICPSNGVGEG